MARRITHGTTTGGGVVDTVTLEVGWPSVEIIAGTEDDLYVTVDGVTDPEVEGDDIEVVPAGSSNILPNGQHQPDAVERSGGANFTTEVRLTSQLAAKYHITGR